MEQPRVFSRSFMYEVEILESELPAMFITNYLID